MTKRMLIDAVHPEETRVVVLDNQQVDEFDFEAQNKAPIRGNIYLAKITRVEPSLQAAFVDYGGNRHGFLAFNEIHPDYYQIPVGDREALLAEHAQEERDQAASEDNQAEEDEGGDDGAASAEVENIGGDAHEEAQLPENARALHRKYKIQEVIKRRQIILVQVMKEERGNKGAALTTYLSLAGRYCVLMPNTARGGGISRKINNASDRKKLKKIVEKLDVQDGMGLIVRTAGAQRTLVEIKRDWQYLSRMWEDVRNLTVNSMAPARVYEEGSLIRRSIRDVYSKDFEEIIVSGEDAYSEARNYMKLLMPSHARKVKKHKDDGAIFKQYGVEDKLSAMFNPIVALPSGGYLVINPTEALVSIDVNSGKSTREFSVEKTAVATNLEAAAEVARQARLRDLAGLLVIDFIDMDENRNNRAVERKLKESLKKDRARIQVGRISSFGLMEMSRQRMRAGVLEGSSLTCAHCNGSGMVRSVESRALHVLRQIDEAASRNEGGEVTVQVPEDVAIYLLNNKRQQLGDIEASCALTINVEIDRELTSMEMTLIAPNQGKNGATTRMEGDPTAALEDDNGNGRKRRRGKRGGRQDGDAENGSRHPDRNDDGHGDGHDEAGLIEADAENDADARDASANGYDDEDGDKPRRRRRRGRRGGRRRRRDNDGMEAEAADKADAAEAIDASETIDTGAPIQIESEAEAEAAAEIDVTAALDEIVTPEPEETSEEAPKKPKTRRKRTVKADKESADKDSDKDSDEKPKKPTRRIRTKKTAADETPAPIAEDGGAEESAVTAEIQPVAAADSSEDDATNTTDTTDTAPPDDTKPARRGWWRRGEA